MKDGVKLQDIIRVQQYCLYYSASLNLYTNIYSNGSMCKYPMVQAVLAQTKLGRRARLKVSLLVGLIDSFADLLVFILSLAIS